MYVCTPTGSHMHLGSTSSWAQISEIQAPEKAQYLLICSRQNKVEAGYAQVVWLNQLLKLTASSQTVYLTLPPTSPAVPQCRAICACLLCSFSSSSLTCLDCTPKPAFPGPPPRVASCYGGSTQEQDKGMSALYSKYNFCDEYVSSGNSLLLAALLDFRITVLSCSILNCHLKKKTPNEKWNSWNWWAVIRAHHCGD